MTREEMLRAFAKMLDEAWQSGWDEGYHRGEEDFS